MGVPSQPFGERFQAINLIKRYVYALSLGVKKVFWWNMVEGEFPLEVDHPSNHFGLVYDGIGPGDPGYGVKKLAYYSYKKMIEVLEGTDWTAVKTVQASDGMYVYQFSKNGKPIWVVWNDRAGTRNVTISDVSSNKVRVTQAVPPFETGKEVTGYDTAFKPEIKSLPDGKITIGLKETPVFVEAL